MLKDRLLNPINIRDTLFWDGDEIFNSKPITSPRGPRWVEGILHLSLKDEHYYVRVTKVSKSWALMYPPESSIDIDRSRPDNTIKWRKLTSADWWDIWMFND